MYLLQLNWTESFVTRAKNTVGVHSNTKEMSRLSIFAGYAVSKHRTTVTNHYTLDNGFAQLTLLIKILLCQYTIIKLTYINCLTNNLPIYNVPNRIEWIDKWEKLKTVLEAIKKRRDLLVLEKYSNYSIVELSSGIQPIIEVLIKRSGEGNAI